MNLSIVLGAVAALEAAIAELIVSSPAGLESLERSAKAMALASCAEAMSRALEALDRELVASSGQAGSRVHSRRTRTLATTLGDVTFRRTVLLGGAGNTACPLDEELGLPLGDRVSPAAREFLVTCAATPPRSAAARRWARWRPSSSTCTRCAWRRSRARGLPREPTRWRGSGAGCTRDSSSPRAPARGPARPAAPPVGTRGSRGSSPPSPGRG